MLKNPETDMSKFPIYRFFTRAEILESSAMTHTGLTHAIEEKALNPVIESDGTERFSGAELEAYFKDKGFGNTMGSFRHEA